MPRTTHFERQTPGVAFRAATEADLPQIITIIEAAYLHYVPILGGRRPRPMDDDHAARIERGETFLLEDAGRPVGVTSMARQGDAMHIFNIAIHPDAQGMGHLRRVLGFAEERGRASGARRLTLFTNGRMTRNRAIYPHVGFTQVHEEDAPGGHTIVFFEKPLGA